MPEYLCKKCGKIIVPGTTSSGKKINFDAGQPAYLKVGSDTHGIIADLEPDAFIDHERICPNKDAVIEDSPFTGV